MLHSVERRPAPSVDEFVSKYLYGETPVVFRGLFEGQEIERIRTLADLRARLGHLEANISREYIEATREFLRTKTAKPFEYDPPMALGKYCSLLETEPTSTLMSLENFMPADLAAMFEPPKLATGVADESGIFSWYFVGPAAGVTSLHFDGAIASGLHHQVFGRKRWLLARPQVSPRLLPIEVSSMYSPNRFSEAERRDFVSFIDGYDTVLEPGDTLFIPVQFWHHVDYLEPAFSFVLRFKRNPFTRWLAREVHRDYMRQNIACKLYDDEAAHGRYRADFDELRAACEQPYESWEAKYKAIKQVFRTLYRRMCPDAIQQDYHWIDVEPLEERIVNGFECTYENVAAARKDPRQWIPMFDGPERPSGVA
jgi:hypothetical protein